MVVVNLGVLAEPTAGDAWLSICSSSAWTMPAELTLATPWSWLVSLLGTAMLLLMLMMSLAHVWRGAWPDGPALRSLRPEPATRPPAPTERQVLCTCPQVLRASGPTRAPPCRGFPSPASAAFLALGA
jgi:hypothetical protein